MWPIDPKAPKLFVLTLTGDLLFFLTDLLLDLVFFLIIFIFGRDLLRLLLLDLDTSLFFFDMERFLIFGAAVLAFAITLYF